MAISTISIAQAALEGITGFDALLALLRHRGPMSYGAVSSTLGWGATRGWRVETELRQGGCIWLGPFGRTFIIEQTE